ncbi:MAG: chromosomal replication initiator protein DnaA [bacterium]
MEMTSVKLWEETLSTLQKQDTEISEEMFDLWLKPTKGVSLEENSLVIEVPNKFFQDWLSPRIDTLSKVASGILNRDVTLRISVSQELAGKISDTKEIEPLGTTESESTFLDAEFNPKYTFASFVVGPSNRFAHAASEAVAKDPARAYNPLFIYGGVGLGKTHLMHAIGRYIKETRPELKILYITSEKFINEFINSIRYEKPLEFRNKFRKLDVLLIDDIQFLGGKESSQEEFFHTFNTLYDYHKQIIVSSDRPPKELPSLEERLISRFEWGLVTDIQPPDLETRIAILRKKAETEDMAVPDDAILFIANKIKANIRELEGALIRIVAFSSLTGSQITVDLAENILQDILPKGQDNKPVTLELIQETVARHFNMDVKNMKSKRRTNAIAFPRQIAMYLARDLTEYSYPDIGRAFGGRDHATVMHGYEKVRLKVNKDPYFNALVNKIIKEING